MMELFIEIIIIFNSYGFYVTSDGKKLYTASVTAYSIFEFDLETPWDFNSYIYPQNMSGVLSWWWGCICIFL